MIGNESPDYEKWAFYVACLDMAVQVAIWLTS